jgi:hypothetical protein
VPAIAAPDAAAVMGDGASAGAAAAAAAVTATGALSNGEKTGAKCTLLYTQQQILLHWSLNLKLSNGQTRQEQQVAEPSGNYRCRGTHV